MPLWLDLARVLVAGIALGLLVGKLVVLRPRYLERIRPRTWLPSLRRMRRWDWFRLITIALAFAAISLAFIAIVGVVLRDAGVPLYSEEEYPFSAKNIQEYPPLLLLLLMLAVAIVLPILEEWIFRGILLEEVALRSRSKFVGVLLSSLIFAAFHLSNPGTYPALAVPLIGAGFLMGACYLLSGLAGAIIAHNAYNSILMAFTL